MFLKNCLILFLLVSNCICGFAQLNNIVYKSSGNQSSTNILILPDNTKIIATRINATGWGLMHIDNEGNILKNKSFSNTQLLNKLIHTSDGNLILVGSIGTTSNKSIGIIKVDLNFNILWRKSISNSNLCYAYSAMECQNTDILITGYSSLTGSSTTDWDSFVCRIDKDGNLKWKKTIQSTSNSDWLLESIELSSGNIILTGAVFISSVDFFLMKISPNGTVLSSKYYGSSMNEVIYNVSKINNSEFIVSNGSWSFGLGEYDLVLSRIDTNFNIIWTRLYGGNRFDFPISNVIDNNNIIVAAYSRSYSVDNTNDIVVYKFQLDGQQRAAKKIGKQGNELFGSLGNTIRKTGVNKYIVTGETNSFGPDSDVFISEFDIDNSSCCDFVSEIPLNSSTLNLSSNSFSITAENTSINTFANNTTISTQDISYTRDTICAMGSNLANNISTLFNNVCRNNPYQFTSTLDTNGISITWNFDDPASGSNNSSNLQNPQHNFSAAGVYNVICIAQDNCNSDTDTIIINVLDDVVLNTTISASSIAVCPGDTIYLTALANDSNVNYGWNFGDPGSANNTSTDSSTFHIYNTPGNYLISLLSNNLCYTDTSWLNISILDSTNFLIQTNVDTVMELCHNQSFNFTASSNDPTTKYFWDFGDASSNSDTCNTNSCNYSYNTIGTYFINLTCNNDCITKTIRIQVNVLPSTPISNNIIQDNSVYCENNLFQFFSSFVSASHAYTWNFLNLDNGQSFNSASMHPEVMLNSAGDYLITCMVSDACNSHMDSLEITVDRYVNIDANIDVNTNINCKKDTVKFQGISNDSSVYYFWNFGDPNSLSNTSNSANPMHMFSDTGSFTVRLICTNQCGADTSIRTIYIPSIPESAINFNIDTCSNILNLSSSSNQNIQWSINGQNSNSVVLNQVLERKRQYDIYLIQNPNSICADTTSLSIDYDVQDVNRTIMIADAFSPNGDGINDILNVYIGDKCFLDEFKIYNRWGEIVYESNDPNKFYWDGKDLNNTVTDGVYILYLKSAESKIIRTVSLIK